MRRCWPLPRNTGNDRGIAPRAHSDLPKLRRKIMEQAGIVVVHKNKTLRTHLVNFLAQEGLKILADFDSLAELRANPRASNPGVMQSLKFTILDRSGKGGIVRDQREIF